MALVAVLAVQEPAPLAASQLQQLLAQAQARVQAVQPILLQAQARALAFEPLILTAQARALEPLLAQTAALQGLEGLEGLAGLEALQGLDALDALDALDVADGAVVRAQQDPADSLWSAARRALNRGDYSSAANLYGDIAKRYPNSSRAADAHYWAAFALYKTDDASNLRLARTVLATQKSRYPNAATAREAETLLARIQTTLAKQGDSEAAAWIAERARQAGGPTGRPPQGEPPSGGPSAGRGCPSEDDDDDMRIAALNGLLQMDAANAMPILRKVLARRDPCAAVLRRKAVFLVSQKRTSETEDLLLDVAQHDPDSEVRQQAVFWLSQVPTERALGMLDSILRTSTDEELLDKAIFAVSQHHSARAGQILRAYAERAGARGETREKAIFWLGQQRSQENAEFLRGLYAKLSDDDLKDKVIFSLSQMGGAENMRWMMDIAVNERESTEQRKKALFWAGQSGADLGELAALYDRLPNTERNTEMKEQLIFVYSQRHEPAALDALIKIARTEPNRELRKKAVFWLGQSHDPRAAQVLLEIINQ
ncbi:MAG: hypothetical protein AUH42_05355 [Gemmatimonadetes bacterium 13_1_40CM_70_11]|nr:MAG: hypothetical protein AUH42_05355 [Gemmatimonadetes bacterium 13_1_40CM_70_11]